MLEIDSSEDPLSGILTPSGIGLRVGPLPFPPSPELGCVPELRVTSDRLHSRTNIDVPND